MHGKKIKLSYVPSFIKNEPKVPDFHGKDFERSRTFWKILTGDPSH